MIVDLGIINMIGELSYPLLNLLPFPFLVGAEVL